MFRSRGVAFYSGRVQILGVKAAADLGKAVVEVRGGRLAGLGGGAKVFVLRLGVHAVEGA